MTDNTDFPLVFDFEEKPVRTVDRNGEVWFVASDVCSALTIGNSRDAISRLDDDEKGVGITDTLGGRQEVTIINESGLYSLTFSSRKDEAKRFRKWVTSEVLPAIRKTGGYNQAQHVPRLSTLSRTSVSLINALKKETNPAARRLLHEQLALTCRMMGIQAPALGDIGHDAPEVPSVVEDFWGVYEALTTGPDAVALNHSSKPGVIAINLIEVCKAAKERGLELAPRMQLANALRLSRDPRFLEASKSVRSHDGRTVRCWLFEASGSQL